jgi:hypothetical protein
MFLASDIRIQKKNWNNVVADSFQFGIRRGGEQNKAIIIRQKNLAKIWAKASFFWGGGEQRQFLHLLFFWGVGGPKLCPTLK